ncbi:hypothetical protein B296_00045986, partial [Ensete ventricosum]
WTGRGTRLGQRTSELAEIRDSDKGLAYWLRQATRGKGLVDWPRYATRIKDWRTGRGTRLGQRTGGLAEIRDSDKGLVD